MWFRCRLYYFLHLSRCKHINKLRDPEQTFSGEHIFKTGNRGIAITSVVVTIHDYFLLRKLLT